MFGEMTLDQSVGEEEKISPRPIKPRQMNVHSYLLTLPDVAGQIFKAKNLHHPDIKLDVTGVDVEVRIRYRIRF